MHNACGAHVLKAGCHSIAEWYLPHRELCKQLSTEMIKTSPENLPP